MMNTSGNVNIKIKEIKNNSELLEKNKELSNEKIINRDKDKDKDKDKNSIKSIEKKSNMTRCMKCNKKLKLIDIKCKCGEYFCSQHIYSDSHDCKFDYKKLGKEYLEKNNPIILPTKVNKL
jgi:AN1-type zinc finger protein 5/6